ncbi:MAG: hypothetical protein JW952_07085 [Candidatus Eisenbacteria bacterium]|nr:hypothetical protein [Candidatus Eisenbacteria bacterium]
MRKEVRLLALAAWVMTAAGWHSAGQCGPIFEERGTLMVGVQGQYGLLTGDAEPADEFDRGPGYALRLRYYMGDERAIGISMENQQFDGIPGGGSEPQPRDMTVAVFTADYLFYFQRPSALTRYLAVGVGFHHPARNYDDGSEVGPDGLVLTAGAGLEYFFHRVVSFDVCVRGYGLFGQGGLLGSGEAAAGLNFYIVD